MFSRDDPSVLWVSPSGDGGAIGTFDHPFPLVGAAVRKAGPGTTIVLKNGIYRETLTVQASGTAHQPLRIVAEHDTGAVIEGACWYFYDISDIIVSQLTFRNTPHGALSVIGRCRRNRFEFLRFLGCGTEGKESCTFFFGGSGSNCNIVENCRFECPPETGGERVRIGLMVSEGNADEEEPNTDHLFRRNVFANYTYGILAGTRDSTLGGYGHIIEGNLFRGCTGNGIMVKCGDTQVRGNSFEDCGGNAISVTAGTGTTVENNRIVNAGSGLVLLGAAHTVQNNCFYRCGAQAVHVCGAGSNGGPAASNVIIEHNTCIECGENDGAAGNALRIDPGTSCVVRRNLFCGAALPYPTAPGNKTNGQDRRTPRSGRLTIDNLHCDARRPLDGCGSGEVSFASAGTGNFENNSGFGASGKVLTPEFMTGDQQEGPLMFAPVPDADGPGDTEIPPGPSAPEMDDEEMLRTMFFGN
jgi:hypothetical protein